MSTVTKTDVSPDEYLAFERQSELKHEYRDGEIVEMVGGTRRHNLIIGNLIWILGSALREKDYEFFPSEMRVKIDDTGLYTYPDVSVVKGRSQLADDHFDTLLNPAVIFEVLSPSTESYDRGEKWEHYRTIDSLLEYLLVSQDRIHVDRYTRQDNGQWLFQDYSKLESVVELNVIECPLKLADVYLKVPMTGERKS